MNINEALLPFSKALLAVCAIRLLFDDKIDPMTYGVVFGAIYGGHSLMHIKSKIPENIEKGTATNVDNPDSN